MVAQNLLATPRTATLTIRLTQKTPVAVDLNTNEKLPLAPTANGLTLPVPLDPWGATLVMVSGG